MEKGPDTRRCGFPGSKPYEVVCLESGKPQQRRRWNFLRRHHLLQEEKSWPIQPF